jgi:hypothetical protein
MVHPVFGFCYFWIGYAVSRGTWDVDAVHSYLDAYLVY